MVFQFVQINDPAKRLIIDIEQHADALGVDIEQDTAADKLVCAEGHSVDLFSPDQAIFDPGTSLWPRIHVRE